MEERSKLGGRQQLIRTDGGNAAPATTIESDKNPFEEAKSMQPG